MARNINSSYVLNQSLVTGEVLNVSDLEDILHTTISRKNWPALLILVIIVLTVGGNILVILAVSLEKKLQNATNYFLMSLAVADMLVGILVMPVSLITILYDGIWPFPEKLCPVWIYLDVLFSTASIMHLCAISLDRYIGIRNPIEHSRFNSRTIAIIKITAVWTISIGNQKQKRTNLHVVKKGNSTENAAMIQTAETPDKTSRSPVNKEAKLFRKGIMQSINNEQRASKVLGIVFFLFVVMWCPFFVTNVMSVICKDSCNEAIIGDLLNVFVWVGYTSSGVNPLVYTLFNGAYRRAFSHYICCHYRETKNNFTVIASTSAIHERNFEMSNINNGNKSPSNNLRVPEERLHVTVESTVSSIDNCIIISEKVSCV